MTKTLRLLLPLTAAALLASCGTTATPNATRLTAQDGIGKLNIDICPSCGRPAPGAWVAPAQDPAALHDAGDVIEGQASPTPIPAFVSQPSEDLVHLILSDTSNLTLPVACFLPLHQERPKDVPELAWRTESAVMNVWTGGTVQRTGSLRLEDLSIQKGDELCRETFGEAWHMLRVNDSVDALEPGTTVDDLWAFTKS